MRLLEAGNQVRVFVRESSNVEALDLSRVEVVRGDLRNLLDVERAVNGCHLVFHLAVVRGDRELSVVATKNLACAAARSGVTRLVFPSSTRVYGMRANHGIDEQTPVHPDSRHGRLKLEAERRLLECDAHGPTRVVIARLPLVLGPGGTAWRGVVHTVASGRFRWIGRGDNLCHPVDVSDVVEGLSQCGTAPGIEGRVYLLGGPEARPLRAMIDRVAALLGVATSTSGIPATALHVYKRFNPVALACSGRDLPRFTHVQLFLQDSALVISRARMDLGYAPRIGVDEMLRRTVASYCRDQRLPMHGWQTSPTSAKEG